MRKRSFQEQYNILQDYCHEMHDHIQELQDDLDRAYKELHYMREFISRKNLEEEFSCFQKNAREEYDNDLPFPRLIV